METIEIIKALVIEYMPSIVAIGGIILTVFTAINDVKKSFTALRNDDNKLSKEIKKSLVETNQQLALVLKENAELKAENKEIKQLITHIQED